MAQASRMGSLPPSLGLDHMPCFWIAILVCSLSMCSAMEQLAHPQNAVGLLHGPLELVCPGYDSNQQGAPEVHWERSSGEPLPGPKERVQRLSNGSLFFFQLLEDDFGTYFCSAQKGPHWIRATVKLQRPGMEAVFLSPQTQMVPEGGSVFLQCISGDSTPPAQITWQKDGSPVTKGTPIEGQYGGGSQQKTSGTLHLTNVSKDDEGGYICVTHNPLLNVRMLSDVATLTVQEPVSRPEIIQGPENTMVVMGTEAVLRCAVWGFPRPTVHWFRNNLPLQNDSHWTVRSSGQVLVLSKVSSEDEGFYHCAAQGLEDTVHSQPALLQTAAMDLSFVQEPTNVTAQVGDSITLACRPPPSRPAARVAWFKSNLPLEPTSRYSQQPNGDLLFHSYKGEQYNELISLRVQETDRGLYFCQAYNDVLSRVVSSPRAYLNVLAAPSVKLWPTLVTTAVGSRVTLQCQVSGHPPPSILWSKQGRSVQTGGKVIPGISNSTLHFSSVKVYDEGYYTCQATNSIGRAQGTAWLRVAVSPIIVSFIGEVRSSVGLSAALPCRAVGDLPIRYSWSRGPGLFPLSPSPRIRVDGEGMLNISRIQHSDAGKYHCTAENQAGQDKRTATLLLSGEEGITERHRTPSATDSIVKSTEIQNLVSNHKFETDSSTHRKPRRPTPALETISKVKLSQAGHDPTTGSAQSLVSGQTFFSPTIAVETLAVTQRNRHVHTSPVSEKTQSSAAAKRGSHVPLYFSLFPSHPARFVSRQTIPPFLYPPSYPQAPLPDFQSQVLNHEISLSNHKSSPPTLKSQITDHEISHLYSTPNSLYSDFTESKTPPSNVYSTRSLLASNSQENKTPPSNVFSTPSLLDSNSPENKTPPLDVYSTPSLLASNSPENKTLPLDVFSTPSLLDSNSPENHTPHSDLYTPHSLYDSNFTFSPLYSTLPSFLSESVDNQTPSLKEYSPSPTSHSQFSSHLPYLSYQHSSSSPLPTADSETPPPNPHSPASFFFSKALDSQIPSHTQRSHISHSQSVDFQMSRVHPKSVAPTLRSKFQSDQSTFPFQYYSPPAFQYQSPDHPIFTAYPSAGIGSLLPDSHTPHPVTTSPSRHTLPQSPTPLLEGQVTFTTSKKQNWSPSSNPYKPRDRELTDWPKRNTSKSPMKTSDDTARVKQQNPLSWFPALEKHDIPIVVGVGVSLAFIFIAMAFYSLVQKNDPAFAGREAHRNLGGPCRRGGRLDTGRTYENRAFEDDDLVAVIEQSSPTLRTTPPLPPGSAVALVTDPSNDSQLLSDSPVIARMDLERHSVFQMEGVKCPPSPQPSIQLKNAEDWKQYQDPLLPSASSPKPLRDEGLCSSLTLRTAETCGTPVHHSIRISHTAPAPLLLSHCVSVGVTTVAVDVHLYPAVPSPLLPNPRAADNLEPDHDAPSSHCAEH